MKATADPSTLDWKAKGPRFHFHFTPTSASWLNLVERWFALLTEKQLRRGVHRSTNDPIARNSRTGFGDCPESEGESPFLPIRTKRAPLPGVCRSRLNECPCVAQLYDDSEDSIGSVDDGKSQETTFKPYATCDRLDPIDKSSGDARSLQ